MRIQQAGWPVARGRKKTKARVKKKTACGGFGPALEGRMVRSGRE